MKFDLEEVIKIAEYVRVGSQSSPKTKTSVIVDEYLEVKKRKLVDDAIAWWKRLSEQEKWDLTIHHLNHWVDLKEEGILNLYVSTGHC